MSGVRPPASLPAPSAWVQRWANLIPPGGRVLDLACGTGRHAYWLHGLGLHVTAVDRSPEALASLAPLAAAGAEVLQAELEDGPWPLAGRCFDAVVVTNYLWRPRLPDAVAAVAPGGALLYETFAQGNETVGRPSRPEFLLRPGELLQAAAGLRVVAYEDGFLEAPERFVQRLAAVRATPSERPPRHRL
ncbi:class I SAM-dependent methyltransferase [Pseudorhodoferax sp.]|uniref:class I SAM-dependent methyltransferase n=1 Tax=Pseudorhodoferax sp. TaxID=1993553 RepID=UPI0039E2FB0C